MTKKNNETVLSKNSGVKAATVANKPVQSKSSVNESTTCNVTSMPNGEPIEPTACSPNGSMVDDVTSIADHDYVSSLPSVPTIISIIPTNETVLNHEQPNGLFKTAKWLSYIRDPNAYTIASLIECIRFAKRTKAKLEKYKNKHPGGAIYRKFMKAAFKYPKMCPSETEPADSQQSSQPNDTTPPQQQSTREAKQAKRSPEHSSIVDELLEKLQQPNLSEHSVKKITERLQIEIVKLSTKLKLRNVSVEKMDEELKEQKEKIEKLENQEAIHTYQLNKNRSLIKQLQSQNIYYRKKAEKLEGKVKELKGKPPPPEDELTAARNRDKRKMTEMSKEIIELQYRLEVLEEEQASNVVDCFDEYNKEYTSEFRDCVHKLLEYNVSANRIGQCIEAVLELAGKEANKMPSWSTIRNICAKRREVIEKEIQETLSKVSGSCVPVEPATRAESGSESESESDSMPSPLDSDSMPSPLDTNLVEMKSAEELLQSMIECDDTSKVRVEFVVKENQ